MGPSEFDGLCDRIGWLTAISPKVALAIDAEALATSTRGSAIAGLLDFGTAGANDASIHLKNRDTKWDDIIDDSLGVTKRPQRRRGGEGQARLSNQQPVNSHAKSAKDNGRTSYCIVPLMSPAKQFGRRHQESGVAT
ncbi:hypothetical protein VF21_10622 [Pseudogymnoascus sp. 05NY08]|nr:hypothetical protein VF21_10622 [Pseudogymnoascus sp. 05NY08]